MVKSISLKKNERKTYNKLVGIIVIVFIVCFVSRLFIPSISTDQSTKIGEVIKQNTREYQLIDRSYFPREQRLEVLFLSPITSSNVLDDLKVNVKKGRIGNTNYSTSLKKVTEEIYLLVLTGLEKNWQELQIAIYPKGDDLATISSEQKFHFVRDELPEITHQSGKQSNADYEKIALQFQLNQTKKKQKANQKEQEKLAEDSKKLSQITSDLEKTLPDKTASEKEDVQQTISQNKSKKEAIQKEMDDHNQELTELKEKQAKLEKRMKELA